MKSQIDKTIFTGVRYVNYYSFWKKMYEEFETPFVLREIDHGTRNIQNYRQLLTKETVKILTRITNGDSLGTSVVFLSALFVLLKKFSGNSIVYLKSPLLKTSEEIFCNDVLLPYSPKEEGSIKDLIVDVKNSVSQTYEFQNFPLTLIDSEFSNGAVTNVAFKCDDIHAPFSDIEQFDLLFNLVNKRNSIELEVQFNEQAFTEKYVRGFIQKLENILLQYSDLAMPLQELIYLSEEEVVRQLEELKGVTRVYRDWPTLVSLFESEAETHPDRKALYCEGRSLSYGDLNSQSNRLAYFLMSEYGIRPGTRVGILLDHSEQVVLAQLAILKAGGCYVILEPHAAVERQRFILEDAEPLLVLTQADQLSKLSQYKGSLFCMDIQMESLPLAKGNPTPQVSDRDLAYILYTSGSTGRPKGVMMSQQAVINFINGLKEVIYHPYEQASPLQIALMASFSFDPSVQQVFFALSYGHCLHIVPPQVKLSGQQLWNYYSDHGIEVSDGTPALVRILLSALPGVDVPVRMKQWIIGGDVFLQSDARALFEWLQRQGLSARLTNVYGPTECCINSSYHHIDGDDLIGSSRIPIGKPWPNYQAYILDEHQRLLPEGVVGELYVGGAGLGEGYLNRPDLTRERFVENPFEHGTRLYRTGDLCRWGSEGELDFFGREDNQVKIRGYRVELEEVELCLRNFSGVEDAVVLAKPDNQGEYNLVAYVSPDDKDAKTIRNILKIKNKYPELAKTLYCLPNKMMVSHTNKNETDFLYSEVFSNQSYYNSKIRIEQGDVIFDVGANIGLFSLYISSICRQTKIYAFEPIKSTFTKLQTNRDLYDFDIQIFNYGLSNENSFVNFFYYPNNTALSGRYGDEEDKQVIKQYLINQAELDSISITKSHEIDEIANETTQAKLVQCQVRRLSDVIAEHNVSRIDLLKIDAEKSELDILNGIEDKDWPKIKQIVLEVHNIKGRVAEIENLLEAKGFSVTLEQEVFLLGTQIYNLFAVRDQATHKTTSPVQLKQEVKVNNKSINPDELVRELLAHCRLHLPNYMVPTDITLVDNFTKTIKGSIDKKALLKYEEKPIHGVERRAESYTVLQGELVRIWGEVLQREVGIVDNFFEIGGHSLRAIQVVSRIQSELKKEVKIGDLFSRPTIVELAELLEGGEELSYAPIPLASSQADYPVSHSQKRLWILDQFETGQTAYNVAGAYRFSGDFHRDIFERSLQDLIARHENLRTYFVTVAGEPRQRVESVSGFDFKVNYRDLRGDEEGERIASEFAKSEAQTSFDLSRGPLLRAYLLQLGDQEYVFLLTLHHIISDGWSMDVLVEEMVQLYNAYRLGNPNPLSPLRIQYKDYACWQNEQLQGTRFSEQEQYWLDEFSTPPPVVSLPSDYVRPALKTYNGDTVRCILNSEQTLALKGLSQRHGVSLFITLLTSIKILLYRYTGQEDIVIGSAVAGRDHKDLEGQVGFYVNTLAFRSRSFTGKSFVEILQEVKRTVLNGFNHQQYPFDLLVENLKITRDPSRSPLFDVGFNWYDKVIEKENKGMGFNVSAFADSVSVAKSDWWFHGQEFNNEIHFSLDYNTDLYVKETAIILLERYKGLINSIIKDNELDVRKLNMTLEIERQLNDTEMEIGFDF